MRIIVTVSFATTTLRDEWRSAITESTTKLLPNMKYSIQDIETDPVAITSRIVFMPAKKYHTVLNTSQDGVTVITFTDVETADSVDVVYTIHDPGYTMYQVRCCE